MNRRRACYTLFAPTTDLTDSTDSVARLAATVQVGFPRLLPLHSQTAALGGSARLSQLRRGRSRWRHPVGLGKPCQESAPVPQGSALRDFDPGVDTELGLWMRLTACLTMGGGPASTERRVRRYKSTVKSAGAGGRTPPIAMCVTAYFADEDRVFVNGDWLPLSLDVDES